MREEECPWCERRGGVHVVTDATGTFTRCDLCCEEWETGPQHAANMARLRDATRSPASEVPPRALVAELDGIEDELRDCTAGLEREPTLRDDLTAIADRLNGVVTGLAMQRRAALDAYAAAIRTERDTAWRVAIEGMRKEMPDLRHDDRTRYAAAGWNAALSALADRMGVTNE